MEFEHASRQRPEKRIAAYKQRLRERAEGLDGPAGSIAQAVYGCVNALSEEHFFALLNALVDECDADILHAFQTGTLSRQAIDVLLDKNAAKTLATLWRRAPLSFFRTSSDADDPRLERLSETMAVIRGAAVRSSRFPFLHTSNACHVLANYIRSLADGFSLEEWLREAGQSDNGVGGEEQLFSFASDTPQSCRPAVFVPALIAAVLEEGGNEERERLFRRLELLLSGKTPGINRSVVKGLLQCSDTARHEPVLRLLERAARDYHAPAPAEAPVGADSVPAEAVDEDDVPAEEVEEDGASLEALEEDVVPAKALKGGASPAKRATDDRIQVIYSCGGDACPAGLGSLLRAAVEYNLEEHEAVRRAVRDWSGFDLRQADPERKRGILELSCAALRQSEEELRNGLDSDSDLTRQVSLWAAAARELADAHAWILAAMREGSAEAKRIALHRMRYLPVPAMTLQACRAWLQGADRDPEAGRRVLRLLRDCLGLAVWVPVISRLGEFNEGSVDQMLYLAPDQVEGIYQELLELALSLPGAPFPEGGAAEDAAESLPDPQSAQRDLAVESTPEFTRTYALYCITLLLQAVMTEDSEAMLDLRSPKLDLLCRFWKELGVYGRENLLRGCAIVANRRTSPAQRRAALKGLLVEEGRACSWGWRLLNAVELEEADILGLEHLLQTGDAILRERIFALLWKQSPEGLARSVARLEQFPDNRRRKAAEELRRGKRPPRMP